MRRWALAAGAVVMLAAGASSAQGATFCVQKPSCAQAGGTPKASPSAAITAADANGSTADRIVMGPGRYEDGPFFADGTNPVKLIGSGPTRTTLTRVGNANFVKILELQAVGSAVSNLGVELNQGNGLTGIQVNGPGRRLRVSAAPNATGTGIVVLPGRTLFDAVVALPVSSPNFAVSMAGKSARKLRLRAGSGIVTFANQEQAASVRQARITAQTYGVWAQSGSTVIDQASIRLLGGASSVGLRTGGSLSQASLTARHVTAVGSGGQSTVGAQVDAQTDVICVTNVLTLRNSILRGFETDLRRAQSCFGDTGEAIVNAAWSVLDKNKVEAFGDGKFVYGDGVRNVNPRFVAQGAGNYHLKPSSPLIDRGQPGRPKGKESKVDLDGRSRVLDGNGDGKARRDVGAFERPRKR